MPTITPTNMQGPGDRVINEVTLDGSTDTFTFNPKANPVLVLRNDTGSPLTPTIAGADADTKNVPGIGLVDVSEFSFSEIADGEAVTLPLLTIRDYLEGAITVGSGTGLLAQLLEF